MRLRDQFRGKPGTVREYAPLFILIYGTVAVLLTLAALDVIP